MHSATFVPALIIVSGIVCGPATQLAMAEDAVPCTSTEAGVCLHDATLPKPNELITYDCQSGAVIAVRYGQPTADGATAELLYSGKTFDMFSVTAASGVHFSTEQGLTPDHGLQWRSEGDEAALLEMLMDHTAADPTVIETCTRRTDVAEATGSVGSAELPLGTWDAAMIGETPVAPDVRTWMMINADGRVNGNAGCNNFGGQAVSEKGGLTIENVFATMMMCEGAGSDQENAFLPALERTASFSIANGELVLLDEAGVALVRFVASTVD